MRFRIKKDKYGYFVEKKGWFFWSILFYEEHDYMFRIIYFNTEQDAKNAIDKYVDENKPEQPAIIVAEMNY